MQSKYMIIISFDAIDKKDFQLMKTLPNFSKVIREGSYSDEVESIYPSLTYPAHTTISTGKYPINHGIINNILVQPRFPINSNWYWQRKYIKGKTLYEVAKEKGMKTATFLWPVTGKADIDYNVPEVFPTRPWQNQILVSLLNGNKYFQFDINNKFGHIRDGLKQPNLDDFVLESFLYLLESRKTDFMMVHFTDLDTNRHNYGYSSKEAYDALKRHDDRLGKIINSLEKLNMYDDSTLVVLGDHSFLDADYVIKLNKLFIDNSLISINNKDIIEDYVAYCNYCDGSAYIYLKNKLKKDLVLNLLKKFSSENNNCIKSILSSEEAGLRGADNYCDFMLEAEQGYYFINDFDGDIIEAVGDKYHKATHGYDPKIKDYQTIFMLKGPSIKKNHSIGPMHLTSEGPTLAHILGGSLPEADGIILEDIFEKK